MRINVAVPEAHVSKPVLDAALEAVTRLDEKMIRSGESPTSHQLIAAGARWQPEPPGQEHFDHGRIISGRGHGDCDDWAPLHAATLRVTGKDPGAQAVVRRSGPKRWHAIVKRSDGSYDDPSLAAGMPGRKGPGVNGAWLPLMNVAGAVGGASSVVGGTYVAYPELALRPVANRDGQVESWQARADLPWHWRGGKSPTDVAMVSLHQSPVPDQAVVGAVLGAFDIGLANGAHPDQLKRLSAIAEACEGCPWEELAHRYGPEHATAAGAVVGGFFGSLWKAAKSVAKPLGKLASTGLSVIPGGSVLKTAFKMASPLLKGSIKRGRHKPPQHRKPPARGGLAAARALSRAAARSRPPTRTTTRRSTMPRPAPSRPAPTRQPFQPYPYPVPYPVPMGAWGASDVPGLAWPPKR